MRLATILIPFIVVTFFLLFKCPTALLRIIFKVPIWISSTAIAFLVGHMMLKGVTAPIAALILDAALMPTMYLVKWLRCPPERPAEPQEELELIPEFALPQPTPQETT